jgi:hypothetical protein
MTMCGGKSLDELYEDMIYAKTHPPARLFCHLDLLPRQILMGESYQEKEINIKKLERELKSGKIKIDKNDQYQLIIGKGHKSTIHGLGSFRGNRYLGEWEIVEGRAYSGRPEIQREHDQNGNYLGEHLYLDGGSSSIKIEPCDKLVKIISGKKKKTKKK